MEVDDHPYRPSSLEIKLLLIISVLNLILIPLTATNTPLFWGIFLLTVGINTWTGLKYSYQVSERLEVDLK